MRPAVVATPILFTDVRFTSIKHRFVTTKALNRHYFFDILLFDIYAWFWHWIFHRFWTTLASNLDLIFHHFSSKCPFLGMLFFHQFLEWFLKGFGSILWCIWDLLGTSGVDPRTDLRVSWALSRVLGRPVGRPGGGLGPFWWFWGRYGTILIEFTPILGWFLHPIYTISPLFRTSSTHPSNPKSRHGGGLGRRPLDIQYDAV